MSFDNSLSKSNRLDKIETKELQRLSFFSYRTSPTGSLSFADHDRQMPPELGQPRRVRGQGVLHGGRQSFHPQEQGTNGRFSRSPFGNF